MIKGEPGRVATAAAKIYENNLDDLGRPTITYGEALAEAQRAFSGEGAAATEWEVPVARAPR